MPSRSCLSLALVCVTALPSIGCGSPRSDMELVCHSVERSGVKKMTSAERLEQLGSTVPTEAAYVWAMPRIRSESIKEFLHTVATLHPADKAGLFQKGAQEAGVNPCPYVDELKADYEESLRLQREHDRSEHQRKEGAQEPK